MKIILATVLTIFTFGPIAKAADCSKYQNNEMTFEVNSAMTSNHVEIQKMVEETYACAIQRQSELKKAREELLKEQQDFSSSAQFTTLKTIMLTSWVGTKPDISGENGGEYSFMLLEPIYAYDGGTSQYEGILDNLESKFSVVVAEKYQNPMGSKVKSTVHVIFDSVLP